MDRQIPVFATSSPTGLFQIRFVRVSFISCRATERPVSFVAGHADWIAGGDCGPLHVDIFKWDMPLRCRRWALAIGKRWAKRWSLVDGQPPATKATTT